MPVEFVAMKVYKRHASDISKRIRAIFCTKTFNAFDETLKNVTESFGHVAPFSQDTEFGFSSKVFNKSTDNFQI